MLTKGSPGAFMYPYSPGLRHILFAGEVTLKALGTIERQQTKPYHNPSRVHATWDIRYWGGGKIYFLHHRPWILPKWKLIRTLYIYDVVFNEWLCTKRPLHISTQETENCHLSWCQLCRYWRHLSRLVPPLAIQLASWQLSVMTNSTAGSDNNVGFMPTVGFLSKIMISVRIC